MAPDRSAVLATIQEFNARGAPGFLNRYRFQDSKRYDLDYRGRRYPPKAIYKVAYKFSDGAPETWDTAPAGEALNRRLRALRFRVIPKGGYEDDELNSLSTRAEDELINSSIMLRRGQQKFRDALLKAYGARCAISGCKVVALLDAAHVWSHAKGGEYAIDNGILLRTDLHTLFDIGRLRISPNDRTVHVDTCIKDEFYRSLHGQKVFEPTSPTHRIRKEFLGERWCG